MKHRYVRTIISHSQILGGMYDDEVNREPDPSKKLKIHNAWLKQMDELSAELYAAREAQRELNTN